LRLSGAEKLGGSFFVELIAAFQAHEVISLGDHVADLFALRAVEREQAVVIHVSDPLFKDYSTNSSTQRC